MEIRRVIIVYHGMRSRGTGLRRHLLQLSSELRRRGIDPQVLSLEELPFVGRYTPYVVQRVGNAAWAPGGDYARFLLTRALMKNVLSRRIRGDGSTAVLFEDVYTSFPAGIPSLTIVHFLQSDNLYQHSLSESALRRARAWDRTALMRSTRPAVTVSSEYRRHIAGMLGEDVAAPLGVIPLGIDLEEFPDTRPAKSADVFSLVCLGRLEARKNFGFLFEVLPKVLSAGCDRVRLTIIGDGPLRARLAAEAHGRGVSHAVQFAGSLPPGTVPMALRRHHMLLHPSLRESFAYALLEAKICGLHTVATADVEVPGEFVDHAVSLNADHWARVIVSTYQAWAGGSFRQPSEESIARLRERYSIRRMVDSYLAVLQGDWVLAAPQRQPSELVVADGRTS